MSTKLEERPRTDSGQDDDEPYAHIIYKKGGGAKALVTEAIVMGKELEALCGKRWVPSRDEEGRPICPACLREAMKKRG